MTEPGQREVEHEITIAAPATAVYELIADVRNWPRIYPPTIHVEQTASGDHDERITIWATANEGFKTWSSYRELDPEGLRVTFRQEVSSPPVAEMSGVWIIEPVAAEQSRVRLQHTFRAIDDDPAGLDWIDSAVDRNSRSELAGLRGSVERTRALADATFSFADSVLIDGSAKDVYDFINEAGEWPQRLPHVDEVVFTEETPGLQSLEMVTRAANGSRHTTQSYRVCFPHHKITYKQVTMPALMTLHTGCWTFDERDDGVLATSQHTVVLHVENITRILGTDATIADAREHVLTALSTNSRATLGLAKQFAEQRR
jgi:aromatase